MSAFASLPQEVPVLVPWHCLKVEWMDGVARQETFINPWDYSLVQPGLDALPPHEVDQTQTFKQGLAKKKKLNAEVEED